MLLNYVKQVKNKFSNWYQLDYTKELIKTLEINLGDPRLKVVDKKVGGNHSGSWIHPDFEYYKKLFHF